MPEDAPPRPAPESDQLRIAGMVPLSTVDWPGHLAASLFLQGCPLACPYCHNWEILDMRSPGQVAFSQLRQLLSQRRGLLDGVVFSGGEPLAQPAATSAMREVHELGFAVGLHTSGAFPQRLTVFLAQTDWVGYDIKALPEGYALAAGNKHAGERAWEGLEILIAVAAKRAGSERPLDYEVRHTTFPGAPKEEALAVARRLHELGVQSFALQQANLKTARPGGIDQVSAQQWNERVRETNEQIAALGFEQYNFRPAH